MTGRPLGGHDHPVHSAWNFLALWEKLGLSSISHGFSCSQPVPDKTAQPFIKVAERRKNSFVEVGSWGLVLPPTSVTNLQSLYLQGFAICYSIL